MTRIERWCAKAIQQTADTGTEPARYDRLACRVGGSRLVTRQHGDPDRLLRRGWSTFVEYLFCSLDLKAFMRYKPGLDDFRKRFPSAFPETGFSGSGLELYRQLAFLQALEEGKVPENQLYLSPDPEKDGYVLPDDKVIGRCSGVWYAGGFRIPFLSWLAVFSVTIGWIRWLFSNAPKVEGIVAGLFGNPQGMVFTAILNMIVGMGPGVILTAFVFSYFIDWSRGHLTLTNQALYFRGWFVSKNMPLDGIHKIEIDKKAVLIKLPPDEERKFWVKGCHSRWLARTMRALMTERRRGTGQFPSVQEAADEEQPLV